MRAKDIHLLNLATSSYRMRSSSETRYRTPQHSFALKRGSTREIVQDRTPFSVAHPPLETYPPTYLPQETAA
ncbi:MAG: hypothetical protein AAFX40_00975 [Cyanobacteria bacterium J06639_1]